MRQLTLDLLASRLCCQFPRYIAWKPNPGSIATDACLHPWDREYSFAFPPFSLISWVLRKILREKNRSSNHSDTHMANPALICTTSRNVCTTTISSALDKKFISKSTGQKSSSRRNRVTQISSVEGFRQSLQIQEISSNAAKLVSHSRRKSSTTNYELAWGQWSGWCNERQVNPFQAPVNYITNFLSENLMKVFENFEILITI